MAAIIVESTATLKNEDGSPQLGADNKPVTRTYSCEYDFGDDLEGMRKVVQDDSKIYFNARRSFTIDLQNKTRGWQEEGLTDADIDAKVAAWEFPSGAPRGKDPVEKVTGLLANLDEATRTKVLEQLLAQMK